MFFVGVMSGTSCDGADVVVVEFSDSDSLFNTIAANTTAYPDSIKQTVLQLIADQPMPVSVISQLDAQLGEFYALVINQILSDNDIESSQVTAIGLHGQTVCHQPCNTTTGITANTLQLGSAAITAQRTQIKTIANFRQMDMAFGGQGAPLAPILHQQLFHQPDKSVAVLNLGGIANITILNGTEVLGFDTGPASCLMDEHIHSVLGRPFDESGQWAEQGEVNDALLQNLLAEKYFTLAYPKSTGRELFNLVWLKSHLDQYDIRPVDIQRTLLQLTVESIAKGLAQVPCSVDQMVVCGGGVHNHFLLHNLQQYFDFNVLSSAELGLSPDFIEALLMAWMAQQNQLKNKLDLSAITGCAVPHVYGVGFEP